MNSNESTPNAPDMQEFLDAVFRDDFEDDEQIPLWASKRAIPGFPLDEAAFLKTVSRSSQPQACYFGTSTMKLGGERLRNLQAQFSGFYVLVLDDIGEGVGSKIKPEDLPEALLFPTYSIETSPDNYQFGFVLSEPIRDLGLAKEFQRVIVHKAGADRGGCLVNKLVRMPCGVNLKERYHDAEGNPFSCRLNVWNPERLFTPDELLNAVDAGITWEQLQAAQHTGGLLNRRAGTTPHRAQPVYHADLDGTVDPVLEWLNERNLIVNEGPDWIDIECPWSDGHTEEDAITAGYAPIGRGRQPGSRGFNCFHDHCSDNKTRQFLAWVLDEGGPRVSQNAVVEHLVSRYAFIAQDNVAVDMKSDSFGTIRQVGFKNQLSGDIWLPDATGAFKPVNEYTLWAKDPNRMRFTGRKRVPGGARILHDDRGGDPYLNTWGLPEWGDGVFDQSVVDRFVQFIHYLIPKREDADWFLDHIAAKAQDPIYRGAGVIMSTPVEGTGRGTLQLILSKLWGASNVSVTTLTELITGSASADNNSWIVRDWIVIPEAKETDMSARQENRAYESLKRFVETGPSSMPIKEKYLVTQEVDCYGSVIVCSQHGDVLPIDAGGTRFKRIENTATKWSADQFKDFYTTWIETGFEVHLWRWLRARDLSNFEKFARQAEPEFIDEVRSSIARHQSVDAGIGLCLLFSEEKTGGAVFIPQMMTALRSISALIGLDDIPRWERPVKRELMNKTREIMTPKGKRWQPRIDGSKFKIRATVQRRGLILTKAKSQEHNGTEGELYIDRVQSLKPDRIGLEFVAYCKSIIDEVE